jgi:N-methylhydantoinase B
MDATARALRAAVAANHGDLTVPQVLLFARPENERNVRISFDCWGVGGSSASFGLDGWGRPTASCRSILPSVEEWEQSNDVRVRSLEFVPDSCGAGQWRGAPAVEASIELPKNHLYTLCWQGVSNTAQGVQGGGAGSSSLVRVEDFNGPAPDLPRAAVEVPLSGDLLHLRRGGGAGYGDARQRDPAAVLLDYLDGLVTREAAEAVYNVILTAHGRSVDSLATAQLRARPGE